jgi:hypothetical protein
MSDADFAANTYFALIYVLVWSGTKCITGMTSRKTSHSSRNSENVSVSSSHRSAKYQSGGTISFKGSIEAMVYVLLLSGKGTTSPQQSTCTAGSKSEFLFHGRRLGCTHHSIFCCTLYNVEIRPLFHCTHQFRHWPKSLHNWSMIRYWPILQ